MSSFGCVVKFAAICIVLPILVCVMKQSLTTVSIRQGTKKLFKMYPNKRQLFGVGVESFLVDPLKLRSECARTCSCR